MPMMIGDNKGNWQDLTGNALDALANNGTSSISELYKEFSFSFGNMQLNYLTMPGIYIVYGDVMLRQQCFQVRRFDVPEMVELHFAISGTSTINNRITGKRYMFADNSHNLSSLRELDGTAEYRAHMPNRMFEVHLTASHFTSLAKGTNSTLERFAEQMNNGHSTCLHNSGLPITFAMHTCINDIINCNFKGGLKHLFLQSKCMELLSLQAEAFDQAAGKQPPSVLRSSYDRDCIIQAKEYLLQHMDQPPTLGELATITGTNIFKLKNGFKELFNNTVFGYLNDVKLSQAKELLLSGQTIKDVTDHLGYSSVQHFGSAFRKKFGTTPGKLRN